MTGDLDTGAWLPFGTFAALLGSSSAACAGVMGPGFGTVVISDTETEAAADSTEAALRVTYCVMITRARMRGWSGSAGQPVAAPPGGLRG
jgi:hypothetical protein